MGRKKITYDAAKLAARLQGLEASQKKLDATMKTVRLQEREAKRNAVAAVKKLLGTFMLKLMSDDASERNEIIAKLKTSGISLRQNNELALLFPGEFTIEKATRKPRTDRGQARKASAAKPKGAAKQKKTAVAPKVKGTRKQRATKPS